MNLKNAKTSKIQVKLLQLMVLPKTIILIKTAQRRQLSNSPEGVGTSALSLSHTHTLFLALFVDKLLQGVKKGKMWQISKSR